MTTPPYRYKTINSHGRARLLGISFGSGSLGTLTGCCLLSLLGGSLLLELALFLGLPCSPLGTSALFLNFPGGPLNFQSGVVGSLSLELLSCIKKFN